MTDKLTQLKALIKPVIEADGYQLWGLTYNVDGHKACLRVFVEHEHGVSVDDCAIISRQIGAVLDVEDPIASRYQLEVSSPGMARQLFEPSQYQAYCGEKIDVTLMVGVDGRKRFKGVLRAATNTDITLELEGREVCFLFSDITKAKLIPVF